MLPAFSALVILEIGSHLSPGCPRPILGFPTSLGWQVHTTMSNFFSIEMDSYKFFCQDLPGAMILLISASHIAWDYSHIPPHRAIDWYGVWSWHQTVILSISASQVGRITDVSHWCPVHSRIFFNVHDPFVIPCFLWLCTDCKPQMIIIWSGGWKAQEHYTSLCAVSGEHCAVSCCIITWWRVSHGKPTEHASSGISLSSYKVTNASWGRGCTLIVSSNSNCLPKSLLPSSSNMDLEIKISIINFWGTH
jgi:hypothetical protein